MYSVCCMLCVMPQSENHKHKNKKIIHTCWVMSGKLPFQQEVTLTSNQPQPQAQAQALTELRAEEGSISLRGSWARDVIQRD